MDGHRRGNRVILITGASSGFGELAARRLLELGHTVYAAARRMERMAELQRAGAALLQMDVTDEHTVVDGVERVVAEQGGIDGVLANAGYGSMGMVESIPMQEIQRQYDVNVFGVARTIKAVLPHMRRQQSGRVIITASVVSHVAIAGMGWYASTKHAIRAMADALRQEVRDLGIDVVLVEPGAVRTNFDQVAFAALEGVEHPEEYRCLVDGFRAFMARRYARCPGPEATVAAMVEAATAHKPKTRYRTTLDARALPLLKALLSDRVFDRLYLAGAYRAGSRQHRGS